VLPEILTALEGLGTDGTPEGSERDVHPNMTGDVVPLDCLDSARIPVTLQTQIIRRPAPNMTLSNMLLRQSQSPFQSAIK